MPPPMGGKMWIPWLVCQCMVGRPDPGFVGQVELWIVNFEISKKCFPGYWGEFNGQKESFGGS